MLSIRNDTKTIYKLKEQFIMFAAIFLSSFPFTSTIYNKISQLFPPQSKIDLGNHRINSNFL